MSFGYIFISVTTLFFDAFNILNVTFTLSAKADGTKIISSQGVGHRTGIEPVTLNVESLCSTN